MIRSYYYSEELPLDLLETMTDDEAFECALNQIRERQKVWRSCATWTLLEVCRETGLIRVKYSFNK